MILGTSHVARQSIDKIKKAFSDFKPDIVALELDKARLLSLKKTKTKQKNIDKRNIFKMMKEIGFLGSMFYLFGRYMQKKIGNIVDIEPGIDMASAYELAKKSNSEIRLIDQDINITLRKFSREFKKKELFKIIRDLVFGMFIKKSITYNLNFEKIPDSKLIYYVLEKTKKDYASLYKILIDDRNKIMAERLYRISLLSPEKKILAVVGAGHVPGIKKQLADFEVRAKII